MTVYVVDHKDVGFTGVMGGVDFYNGRGSTSSAFDVVGLVREGCRLPDEGQRAEIRALAIAEGRRRRKKLAEIADLEAFERTPAYVESALRRKAEREEAAAKRKENRPRSRHR